MNAKLWDPESRCLGHKGAKLTVEEPVPLQMNGRGQKQVELGTRSASSSQVPSPPDVAPTGLQSPARRRAVLCSSEPQLGPRCSALALLSLSHTSSHSAPPPGPSQASQSPLVQTLVLSLPSSGEALSPRTVPRPAAPCAQRSSSPCLFAGPAGLFHLPSIPSFTSSMNPP